MRLKRRLTRGFTLIEIVIVIVLISSMMAGMSTVFMSNIQKSHYPYLRQRALAVAVAFLDEIQHKRWHEDTPLGGGCVNTGATCASGAVPVIPIGTLGPEVGEGRADYDDIDDYAGINQAPPQNSAGINMPGYAGFSVIVTVSQPAADWEGVTREDVRLINIAVTSSAGETISLSAYRINN